MRVSRGTIQREREEKETAVVPWWDIKVSSGEPRHTITVSTPVLAYCYVTASPKYRARASSPRSFSMTWFSSPRHSFCFRFRIRRFRSFVYLLMLLEVDRPLYLSFASTRFLPRVRIKATQKPVGIDYGCKNYQKARFNFLTRFPKTRHKKKMKHAHYMILNKERTITILYRIALPLKAPRYLIINYP